MITDQATSEIAPVFITGNYRSGTTLMAQILNTHSELAITYDSVHFFRFCYDQYNPIEDRSNVRKLVNDVYKRISSRWNMKFPVDEVISRTIKTGLTYQNVYHHLMTILLLKDDPAKRWGEKTNVAWSKIPSFLNLFPKGKALFLIREPRDVLASYKKVTIQPGIRYLDALFTSIHALETAKEYKEKKLPNCMIVKFENLVTEPQATVQHICDFLEIDYESEMLDTTRYKNKTGDQLWKPNTGFTEEIRGISSVAKSRWRESLNTIEILLCEFLVGKQMLDFEYSLSDNQYTSKDWCKAIDFLYQDELIFDRFRYWFMTRKGVESFPSDPLDPKNWGP